MTLFKFNPPGQEPAKETPADTTAQAADAKTPAPESTPAATEAQTQPQVEPQPDTAQSNFASAPAQAQEIPVRPRPEEPRPRQKPTIASERMLADSPGGGRNALIATILAMVLVVVAIGLYVYLGEKPPVAAGEVTNMWIYSVHTTTRPFSGEGAAGQSSSFDQVLIAAKVKLRNQSSHPIVLWDMSSTVKTDSGETDASAVSKNDFQRAFVAYPKLSPAKGTPLMRETILESGQQIEGMLLTHYTMTKDEWEKKSSLKFNIIFRYQKTLVLQPPREVEVIQ